MNIKKIYAEEIFNAQSAPTLQCTITLSSNQVVRSSIPSGFKQQPFAATYLHDSGDRKKGMREAADYINTTVAPILIDQPINALAMDSLLMDLDTTQAKSTVGANTTLVVSYAIFKAQAAMESIELFQLLQSISGTQKSSIPRPIFSIFQGRTGQIQQPIKEFLLIPQEDSIEKNIEAASLLYHHTRKLLSIKKYSTAVSSFGSFALPLTMSETFHLIKDIFKTLPEYTYNIGLNVSASDLYDAETKTYHWHDQAIIGLELLKLYQTLIKEHPYISYIQDGMAQLDQSGWKTITEELPSHIYLAGDTVFGSNAMQIRKGILQKIANCTIIRPEAIGTVSQTLAAIDACKNNDRNFIIAADTGETDETFCSDLSVGTGAQFFKAGNICRAEFTKKYNRLLTISKLM